MARIVGPAVVAALILIASVAGAVETFPKGAKAYGSRIYSWKKVHR